MSEEIDLIKDKIKAKHSNDEKQLEAIFSLEKRLLIEAPAGYGKTNTMVSKIAYMLLTNQIPYPKKILALTFSVNAAYKIKRDVLNNVPIITDGSSYKTNVNEKIFVSNYHGFARRLLKRSGYKINNSFLEIDTFKSIDDKKMEELVGMISGLSIQEGELMSNFNKAVKNLSTKSINFLKDNFKTYNDIIITKVIPHKIIPYNAILTLALMLLKNDEVIRNFYKQLFTVILADEFQDTNILSYWLLSYLISDDSKLILLGDPLQRIYGFIGAIPDLFSTSEKQFSLSKIVLGINYRFNSNKEMLLLDNNLRRNAEKPFSPDITENARLKYIKLNNQENEAIYIVDLSLQLLKENPGKKIAILAKQRGYNINKIIDEFIKKSVPFFYSLFTDDDTEYINFNKACLQELNELLKINKTITKKIVNELQNKVQQKYKDDKSIFTESLLSLLKVFFSRLFLGSSFLSNDEKINLVREVFEYNGLKQYIEFVDSDIILSTVHGSKGLEWDFVILPDMEKSSFPGYLGLCKNCSIKGDCNLVINADNEKNFLEELSVFYVAVTRARKQIYFTSSEKQINYAGDEVDINDSCFLRLPGISFV
ncbi:MAG: ATP-dependent helicase [Candidatus Buchananbacteria bacterium]|jgi:DNA helicase-2/ATP-dependent DNA helicase PcrA